MPVDEPTTMARALAAFVTGLTIESLPGTVVTKVKTNMLHDLGCAMAAHGVGESVWPLVTAMRPAEAALLCSGVRVPVEHAAFANAVLVHARAQDDTHFSAKSHAGAVVISAALAMAQRLGSSGSTVIPAIVAGYETAATVGEIVAASATERGFRASSVFGPLGAAATTAVLLGLDAEQTAHAISIAMSFSCGLNQTWIDGSTEWRWEVGIASRNGVLAAELAARGAHGATYAFEGAAGFARAFGGIGDARSSGLDLGNRWRILDVIYKPHPVCNITQSAVSVAAGLARHHDLQVPAIVGVRCYLNPADRSYPGTLNRGPFADVGGSLMSAPYCVAMALRDRRATLAGLAAFDDAELSALIDKVQVLPDEGLPVLSARIEVDRADGATVSDELVPEAATYNWDWDTTWQRVQALRPEMAHDGAGLDQLHDALDGLERLASVDPVLAATVAR